MIAKRYDVIGQPFVGGMATVWKCRDIVLERNVALKIMPAGTDERRMRDELQALLRMRSKHVVQIYDILDLDGNFAIVQEFIDGKDLLDAETAPSSVDAYLKMLWQIASGISDIHEIGIIHRDIKPNNMKVDPEGVIKIFDFGLARDEGPSAATKGFVGTVGFAAPELYNSHAVFTAAVDAYAFGATALFLYARNLPQELKASPPGPLNNNYFSALSLILPQDVQSIINCCLAQSPSHRPVMRAVVDVLAKHLLYNKHRALIVFNGEPSYLDATRPEVVLRLSTIGEIKIHYDGFDFLVDKVSGEVFMNNVPVTAGDRLPGACVIAFGSPERRSGRKYITFDVSHPEVVL